MKAKPIVRIDDSWVECDAKKATHVWLHIPGPIPNRLIPVVHGNADRKDTCCWSWNGDTEKPTLKPSIRTRDGDHTCHTWVNDGMVQFLSDSTHQYSGQTMELLEVDW